MSDENELLFDELYEKTKDCGRVQFIKLLMQKEREIQELKEKVKELSKWDKNKDSRNSRQRIANKNLLKKINELKKQLEEWNYHLKCSKEMLDIQGHNGNYNYDSYMLGIYNGMEYIIALFETREPIFKSGKDIEFISDKTQQKEFIEYLTSYIDLLSNKPDLIEEAEIDILEEILSKYKEIIGISNENNMEKSK